MPARINHKRYCTMEWCEQLLYAKGMCHSCYEKNRNGRLRDPRIPVPVQHCAGPECERVAGASGLCKTHYSQKWHGKELSVIKPAKEVPEREGQRWCRTCDKWKDRENDYYNTSGGAKQGECKPCMIKRNAANNLLRKMKKEGVDE